MTSDEENSTKKSNFNNENNTLREVILYFTFAIIMMGLNIIIQNLHEVWFLPIIRSNLGDWNLIQKYYLSTDPYDMPELIGSIIAVGITYIVKFILDKFIVFRKNSNDLKETGKQFSKYFIFAIFTTLENIGIQFLLENLTTMALNIRILIALTIGYITKYFLDKKYAFN